MTATNPLHQDALELHARGINVIPIRHDGSKAPVLRAWEQHITTEADIDAWFGGDNPHHRAIGAVTGAASENLEMAEIEGRAAGELTQLAQLAEDSGIRATWDKVNAGWLELTPSGGIHWFYRVEAPAIPGSMKLAMRPSTPDELTAWKAIEQVKVDAIPDPDKRAKRQAKIDATQCADVMQTLAETRGNGGQSVIAPTPGTAHETGRPWARLRGGPATVPTLTWDERDQFLTLLSTLDQRDAPTEPEPAGTMTGTLALAEASTPGPRLGGITPGDDFEERNSWPDILEPHGWTRLFTRGATTYWCRPGKTQGISATTGHAKDRDRLYVFSSSTDFDTFTPYTKFGAHAHLNHGGDHSAAATRLKADGYGESPTHAATRALAAAQPQPGPTAATPATVAGTAAEAPLPFGFTLVEAPRQWGDVGLRSHQRMAARLATFAAGKFLFVAGIGWHRWDGTRWEPDTRGTHINGELTTLLRQSWVEAINDKDLEADVKASMTATGSSGTLNLASFRPEISTERIDTDPWLLNTPTGTLDLHGLTLRPHNPDDRITKVTTVGYNPDATSATWEHFLETSLPDPEVRAFLQRYAGLSLIGKVIEHVLVIAHGSQGRNGKGVFARTIARVLDSYATTAPADLLVQSRYGDKRSAGELAAIMRLRGARWVALSELNKGVAMDEATMKSLTGGDILTAKFMGKDPVEFDPSHTIFMSANDLPTVGSDSTAAWARIRAVPWTVSWVGREDVTLEDRIERELEGVLAWMVEGLRQYQKIGLAAPAAVMAETEKYRSDNDPVARFITERCYLGPAASVTRSALLDAYTAWARTNGEQPLTGRQLATLIRATPGVDEYKAGTLAWRGIGLAVIMDTTPEDEPRILPIGDFGPLGYKD